MPASGIPLPDIFAAANSLRAAGLIINYALGGALAAIRYTEPFTTYDADVFFIPADLGLSAGIPAIYEHLQTLGHTIEREHILIRGFPVQWLATDGLTEEAVREALLFLYDQVLEAALPRVDGIAPARRSRRLPGMLHREGVHRQPVRESQDKIICPPFFSLRLCAFA